MALTDYVIMPGEDYQAICDAVRAKTGKTEALKSGDLSAEVAQIEVDDGSKDQLKKLVDGTIESYVFPEDVTEVRGGLFKGCWNLTSVEMHEGITRINSYAFDECGILEDIILSNNLTFIGDNAFRSCRTLKEINWPTQITSIEQYTFFSCRSLIKINIPEGVTNIGIYALGQCIALLEVSLPSTIQTISNVAFGGCTALKEVTFYGIPLNIATNAFGNCAALTTINVPWSEGEVANAPWGATNATINYNYIPPEEPEKVKIFNVMTRKHATIVSDLILGVSTRLDRGFLYSAATHDRIFMGQDYSPIKIPNGAVYAKIIIPSDMNHAVLICENHPTETRYVNRIHDGEWKTDGIFDVSGYADGEHYIVVKIGYISGGEIPEDFDSSVIDFYFTDANGNVIEPDTPEEIEGDET